MYKVDFEDYISVTDEKGEEILHIEYDADMESVIDLIDGLVETLNKKQDGYIFKIPVGDWSSDGHGHCKYYTVKSNKPVEEVRETHFKIKETFGIDLNTICRSYQDSSIGDEDYEILKNLGFKFDECEFDDDEDNAIVYPMGFAEMWIFLLMQTDKELKLEMINNEVENLTFYGFDEKGRHIGLLGYGCFYD